MIKVEQKYRWNYDKIIEKLLEYNPNIKIERKTNIMKITLSNGVVVEGTLDQINAVARTFGISVDSDGVYYNSSSRGLVRITDMEDTHLKNALIKFHATWAEGLKRLTGYELAKALRDGCQDKTYLGMFAEFARRVAIGKYR